MLEVESERNKDARDKPGSPLVKGSTFRLGCS